MDETRIPRGWLLFWSVVCAFGEPDSDLVRKAVNAALNAGFDEPELIELAISDDLRSAEAVAILHGLISRVSPYSLSRHDVLTQLAREHLRSRFAMGESRALAAFSLPEECVWGEEGKDLKFLKLKCTGEDIYDMEIRRCWFWSRDEKERVKSCIPEFERDIDELMVCDLGFTDKEVRLISTVAKKLYGRTVAVQYWIDPTNPPETYNWALAI